MELNTGRLTLLPLTASALQELIRSQRSFERTLALNAAEAFINDELKEALKIRLSKVLQDEHNYFWHTNWLMIKKESKQITGGIMLKGLPDEKGEVIIGYYTNPSFQNKGYMTEAVVCMKNWLLGLPNVKAVIADTFKDNIASQKVLKKAGAEICNETEKLYYWKFVNIERL